MPSNHISNSDYHENLRNRPIDWEHLYKEKAIDLVKLRHRCSQYRLAAEYALDYLTEMGDSYHPDLNITHLSEQSTWQKLKDRRNFVTS